MPPTLERRESVVILWNDGFSMLCANCDDWCGERSIRHGDPYAEINGETVCGHCADAYRKELEDAE